MRICAPFTFHQGSIQKALSETVTSRAFEIPPRTSTEEANNDLHLRYVNKIFGTPHQVGGFNPRARLKNKKIDLQPPIVVILLRANNLPKTSRVQKERSKLYKLYSCITQKKCLYSPLLRSPLQKKNSSCHRVLSVL